MNTTVHPQCIRRRIVEEESESERRRHVRSGLNRNYGLFEMWNANNGGSSTSTSSDTYRGVKPFSEPETFAISSFLKHHSIKTCFNYHTYGNYLIYPWGYSSKESDDSLLFRQWSYEMSFSTIAIPSGRTCRRSGTPRAVIRTITSTAIPLNQALICDDPGGRHDRILAGAILDLSSGTGEHPCRTNISHTLPVIPVDPFLSNGLPTVSLSVSSIKDWLLFPAYTINLSATGAVRPHFNGAACLDRFLRITQM
jgi:hypothetical protein